MKVDRWSSLLRQALAGVCLALIGASAQAYEEIIYIHNDVAGNPVAATNQSGNVVWRESYKPYGERLKYQDAGTNSIWFSGKPVDPETGLSYFGARYYDPLIGRFISTDPKGFDPTNIHSFNRYSYGNNNPYRYVDPDGRYGISIVAAGTLLIGGAIYYALPTPQRQEVNRRLAKALSNLVSHSEANEAEATPTTATGDNSTNGSSAGTQGGTADQVKDPKRRFDKGQRERAVDNVRDENGDPLCAYCGQKLTDQSGQPNSTEIDHVKPHSRGGSTTDDNAAATCRTCNRSKGAKEFGTEWTPPSSDQ